MPERTSEQPMLNRRSRHVVNVVAVIVATSSVAMMPARAARPQSTAAPCSQPLPPGFVSLDQSFWDGPWAFAAGGPTRAPLPALDNSTFQPTNGPIPVRLDDGSDGALRVESRACAPSEDCTPYDCGCPLERADSYWIEVADGRGRAVSRMHLWAAYGRFQIVPIDLDRRSRRRAPDCPHSRPLRAARRIRFEDLEDWPDEARRDRW